MQENIDSELLHPVHACSGTEEMETLAHTINEVSELFIAVTIASKLLYSNVPY